MREEDEEGDCAMGEGGRGGDKRKRAGQEREIVDVRGRCKKSYRDRRKRGSR